MNGLVSVHIFLLLMLLLLFLLLELRIIKWVLVQLLGWESGSGDGYLKTELISEIFFASDHHHHHHQSLFC